MVLTGRGAALTPTLVVPDEQAWTMAGADPVAAGLEPVFALGEAHRVLVPQRLPRPLADVLATFATQLPRSVEVDQRPLPGVPGRPLAPELRRDVRTPAPHAADHAPQGDREDHDRQDVHGAHGHEMHGGPGGHAGHEMNGGHGMHGDHGDMMAIVGEPSADGLVMEPMELRFGPLATPLPGGLAVDVTLDGDVVAEASVHPPVRVPTSPGVDATPDPLAPVAWRVAILRAAGAATSEDDQWRQVVAVEVERAVSHLAWLRSFGRLIGFRRVIDRCSEALRALAEAHRGAAATPASHSRPSVTVEALEQAREPVHAVVSLVTGSRWLRLRAGGRGVVTADDARARRLVGPVARGSGVLEDSRIFDPVYEQLGFEPVVESGGDALARTRVRAHETAAALDLAVRATRAAAAWAPAATTPPRDRVTVEGPRGPVEARRHADGWRLTAHGADEAAELAAELLRGLEWAAALIVLASFDLSPWRAST